MKTGALVGALVLMSLLGFGLMAPLPPPAELPPAGLDIVDRHGRLLYQAIDPVRGAARPISLDEIAPTLTQATIAVEDASFDANPGVDPLASGRALIQDLAAGRVVAGGSTITQQLARLRYLSADERVNRSLTRKLTESWLAMRLTAHMSKRQILEQYLNTAPYGNLAVGAEAAAWTYFGKPARELSLAESALLAGLPQSPTDYDPFAHFQTARARQRVVLELMRRRGFISSDRLEAARAEALQLNERPFPLDGAHFVDYVRSIAPPGAARVWTTLDRDVQAMAERAARRHVTLLAEHDVSDAAVVVLDPTTGDVLAMVGGVDYFDARQPGAQVNMAVARRQPGSAFKPITYAAALESGQFSAASVLRDERTVFRTRRGEIYLPENYDRRFHGVVPLRVALGSSLNVPAVQVLSEVGLGPVLGLANELGLGLDDPDRYDLSLTLGGAEVRLLDLTGAYGAFSANGVLNLASVITRVEGTADCQCSETWARPPPRRVMSAETAWLITDMLSDDAARGPGFGRESVLNFGTAAVKTGTTSDFRDNWTIGYTPDVVVGVWVGNADNGPMRRISGVTGAAPLWREVLQGVLEMRGSRAFERPKNLVQVELCAESAAHASEECPAHRLEWLPRPVAGLRSRADVALPAVRIVFPDPGTVIVLDRTLPRQAQQLAITVESIPHAGQIEVYVDDLRIGSRSQNGPIAWPPTIGHHVIRARADGFDSEPVEIEVVPS